MGIGDWGCLEKTLDNGFVVVQFQALGEVDRTTQFLILAAALRLLPHALVHLLKNERHAEHDVRVYFLHVLLDVFDAFADRDGPALIE